VPAAAGSCLRGVAVDLLENGQVLVGLLANPSCRIQCDCLAGQVTQSSPLNLGDQVLLVCPDGPEKDGVILGRVVRCLPKDYSAQATAEHVAIEARETITLTCGESSLRLGKDGKMMLLGKDVLVRAKRTARVKAGTVAIN